MPRNFSAWIDACIFLVIYGVTVAVVFSYNVYMGAVSALVWLSLAFFARERCRERQTKFERYFRDIVSNVNPVTNYAIDHLPQAVLLVDGEGRLQWGNAALDDYVGAHLEQGMPMEDFWPELSLTSLWGNCGDTVFTHGKRHYRALYRPVALPSVEGGDAEEKEGLMAFYVMDFTEHAQLQEMYHDSRMVLAYIEIDNFDEVLQGLTEAERTALLFEVNRMLDEWMHRLGGFLRRIRDDFYVAVMERRSLDRALADKFDILDQVRSLHNSNHLPVTLSFGVVVADRQTPAELGVQVQQELDLALGRGGDQAVVLVDGKPQFFGGKATAVEKHTRVKARVVAHSLRDLLQSSDAVYVMGHHSEDFDALGAALGVAQMARQLKKPVHVVLSPMNDGIDKFTDLLQDKPEYADLFVREEALLTNMTAAHPLLVVVDTHIPHMVAAPKLLARMGRVVVIDHHRRSEVSIQNPLLLYLEPSSSSTCELVTELLMYFSDDLAMGRLDATALYAGIVVDTKNFAVQTGVRTFEAAAFLRRAGADPVVIRHIFRSDYETSRTIAKAEAASKLYDGGLIVTAIPDSQPNIQAIAAQTADALLRIEGVHMSIVVFQLASDVVGISARSSGEYNVQVIMEAFGGGGHQNVAGAQIKNGELAVLRDQVVETAQKFIKENG
ncbi:MAG: DHH family phosphoesterase [Schwartzia sp. (in: firmicutes)]